MKARYEQIGVAVTCRGYEEYVRMFDLDERELLRVCRPGGQVRIYPLLTLAFEPYPELDRLLGELRETGTSADLTKTKLPFIPRPSDVLTLRKEAK